MYDGLTLIDPLITIQKNYSDTSCSPCCTWKIPNSEVLGSRVGMFKWNDPFRSGRSNQKKWPSDVWKLFRRDRRDPFSFRPKCQEISVAWIAPRDSRQCVALFARRRGYDPKWRCVGYYQNYRGFFLSLGGLRRRTRKGS